MQACSVSCLQAKSLINRVAGGWSANIKLTEINPEWLISMLAGDPQAADAVERDSWFSTLCLATARQKTGSTDGFYMALQAAPNLRSHGHNDSGSFIIFHDGEPVFVDAGTQAYTVQTFSNDRYKI